MMIFFAILIPIIVAIVLFAFFKHRTMWWEVSIPLVASIIFILIFKWAAISSLTSDTEYWNDAITEARYYEFWDEWITQTCEDCTTDDEGNTDCTTYDCSYQQKHYAHWDIYTTTGWSMSISEDEYKRLVRKYGNETFVDMHRDYDDTDGDMYRTNWNGSDALLECVVRTETYENKPRVSSGIYKSDDVTPEEVKEYALYEYPGITRNHKQDHLLGSGNKKAEHNLAIINARLGPKQQLKAFVLLYLDQTIEAGMKQEDYWEGGNKNEFVVTIGINSKGKVTWCYPFSWSDNETPKIKVRNFVKKQKEILDLVKTTSYIGEQLQNFERKQFRDFDYLKVYPTKTQTIWAFILTFLLNIGLSFWIILNEFNGSDNTDSHRYGRSRYYKRRQSLNDIIRKYSGRRF